ncbi:hypothetical protein DVH24_003146 [Malus domestica]|uniref:DUF2921 domain-containing protein n=1 Tax=Malus domestica TaxID=3750 RepID=A0A498K6Q0_MALDO|nr:hypothetical protein DVH24_003146 [Malus domestica]
MQLIPLLIVLVGDCSTRLSLRFPAILTIQNTSSNVGQIWSKKTVSESGYFEKITFESPQNENRGFLLPGQKYENTKIDRVKKLCPRKETGVSAINKANRYPSPFSYDMRFDMSAKSSKGGISWGSSVPFFVGNRINLVSYAKLRNTSVSNEVLQISAEGIYGQTEGSLCMVGCRVLGSESPQPTDLVDCDIVVNFQFRPSKSFGYIKGSIISTRIKYDPLYFEHLDLTSAAGFVKEVSRSIWRMNVEVTLVLLSATLACVFVAMFTNNTKHRKGFLGSGGWLEVNEVIVRALTIVGFLLKLRLLQLAWTARSEHNESQNELWVMGKKSFVVASIVYAAGALAALFLMDWRKIGTGNDVKVLSDYQKHSVFGALKSYVVVINTCIPLLIGYAIEVNPERAKVLI